MTPESDNGGAVWPFIHRAAVRALPVDTGANVRIIPCDRDGDGQFVRFAGLDGARTELWEAQHHGAALPALLILGMFPPPPAPDEGGPIAAAVLSWCGAQYLRYGFGREDLAQAANAVMEGRKTPLPRGVLPTAGDVRRKLSEVRHWLANRSRNADGAHSAMETAVRGEAALHESHLEPVAAMTEAHRRMLKRLWALEGPAAWMAPGIGGLKAFAAAMDEFELRWRNLEVSRAAVCGTKGAERPELLLDMRERQTEVRKALSAATAAIDDLDRELSTTMETGNGDRAG